MKIAGAPPFLLLTAFLFMAPSWAATTGSAHSLRAQESSTGDESLETDLLDSDLDSIDDLFGGGDTGMEDSNGSDSSDSPLDEEDLFGSSDSDDTTGDAAGDMAGDTADNADGDAQAGDEQAGQGPTILETVVKKKSFTFGASYSFIGGIAPGWTAPPWFWDETDPAFTWLIGAEMNSSFSLDFQLSQSLRVRQTFNLSFPGFVLSVGDFFADYSLANRAFIRLGKYGVAWGIAPNYSYANLPARTGTGFSGDSYAVKADIPVGIGGLQLLTMIRRSGEFNFNDITANDLAIGGKFNLALQGADINIGSFYHPALRFRNSLSVKSTIFGNTEVYAEGMLSMHQESFDDPLFAASIGFMDDFFADRISINAEYGYNGEVQSEAETLGTSILDDGSTVVLSGHNLALNLILRPRFTGILSSMRFFGRVKYNIDQNSGELIPGLNWKPLESMDIYLAVPMAVGSRSGHYYTNTVDEDGRPFAVVLAVTLSGNY